MNSANSNNAVNGIVAKAKSVPVAAYLLVALNILMFVGLVWQDLPLHYFIGMGLFAALLVAAVGQITGFWQVPSKLLGDSA